MGIRKVEEEYWYAYREDDSHYLVYSSRDGVKWDFRFYDDRRVAVDTLNEEGIKEHIRKSKEEFDYMYD